MKTRFWRKTAPRAAFILLALILCLGILAGCGAGGKNAGGDKLDPAKDLERIRSRGTLLVGVTDYPPMDYLEDGEWTGFDADLARLFGNWLEVEVQFVEIDWSKKVQLLESGEIDCIWNGLTKTDELAEKITLSRIYLFNSQVVVMADGQFDKYDSLEKCSHLLFAVEDGSVGQELAESSSYRCMKYANQVEALSGVLNKQCDAAIVDRIIAASETGKGKAFQELSYDFSLGEEDICVGLRKGSALEEQINDFFTVYTAEGTISRLAGKYSLFDALFR